MDVAVAAVFPVQPESFADAVAVATVDLDALSPAARAAINVPIVASQSAGGRGGGGRGRGGANGAPVDSLTLLKQELAALSPAATIRVTRDVAAKLFRRTSIDGLNPGGTGGTVNAALDYLELAERVGAERRGDHSRQRSGAQA